MTFEEQVREALDVAVGRDLLHRRYYEAGEILDYLARRVAAAIAAAASGAFEGASKHGSYNMSYDVEPAALEALRGDAP